MLTSDLRTLLSEVGQSQLVIWLEVARDEVDATLESIRANIAHLIVRDLDLAGLPHQVFEIFCDVLGLRPEGVELVEADYEHLLFDFTSQYCNPIESDTLLRRNPKLCLRLIAASKPETELSRFVFAALRLAVSFISNAVGVIILDSVTSRLGIRRPRLSGAESLDSELASPDVSKVDEEMDRMDLEAVECLLRKRLARSSYESYDLAYESDTLKGVLVRSERRRAPTARAGSGERKAAFIVSEELEDRLRVGMCYGVRSGSSIVIGRSALADCSLPAVPGLSRWHCRATYRGEEVTLTDLGSKNGTYVNGKRITGPRILQSGDQLVLGTAKLVFLTAHDFERAYGEIMKCMRGPLEGFRALQRSRWQDNTRAWEEKAAEDEETLC